jgi:hypothetical protein
MAKKKTLCVAPKCMREKTNFKHGLCDAHKMQLYRNGKLSKQPIRHYVLKEAYQGNQ